VALTHSPLAVKSEMSLLNPWVTQERLALYYITLTRWVILGQNASENVGAIGARRM